MSDVTRAVLAFHAAERNGNGDRGRGGERTVPLESWAARYGWTVDVAERVLWQADVPLKSAITSGDANPIGKDVRIVDAKAAYVGVWLHSSRLITWYNRCSTGHTATPTAQP